MAVLELKGVWAGYGSAQARTEVLKGIDLGVEEGELLAVLGFSGTGKTTLISLLAGLRKPDKGEVLFKGKRVTGPGPERGVVFQSYALMPWLTVRENIALAVNAVHSKRASRRERRALTDKYMRMVGLTHASERRPAELSGGMRQRVSVARALAMQPEVLLLDEPLSALDALTRAKLQDEFAEIRAETNATMVLDHQRRRRGDPACRPHRAAQSGRNAGAAATGSSSRGRATASRSTTTRPITGCAATSPAT